MLPLGELKGQVQLRQWGGVDNKGPVPVAGSHELHAKVNQVTWPRYKNGFWTNRSDNQHIPDTPRHTQASQQLPKHCIGR